MNRGLRNCSRARWENLCGFYRRSLDPVHADIGESHSDGWGWAEASPTGVGRGWPSTLVTRWSPTHCPRDLARRALSPPPPSASCVIAQRVSHIMLCCRRSHRAPLPAAAHVATLASDAPSSPSMERKKSSGEWSKGSCERLDNFFLELKV